MNRLKLNPLYASKVFLRNRGQVCSPICNYKMFHSSSLTFAASEKEAEAKEEQIRVQDVLEDLKEPELTEEQIMQKRFQSRLPERVHKMFIQKQLPDLEMKHDFKMHRLRKTWGTFGKQSKLNPGICWPTEKQILETIEYDKTFEPPLQERLRRVQEKRLEKKNAELEYEAEVDKNMANLDKWISDFHEKKAKEEEKVRQLKSNREKLVEEISEYLGYEIDAKDPRFKEAVEQRDKEKKKALKAKKQQESYDKMLDKLKKIAQQK